MQEWLHAFAREIPTDAEDVDHVDETINMVRTWHEIVEWS